LTATCTLLTLLQVQFKKYLARQFSIAFDVYLAIRAEVDRRVKESLGRQSGDWCIRHTCPACTYKLHGEKHLLFAMLWAMDGNDSLKRILRRMINPETGERDGPSCESMDSRAAPGDIYIPREAVNRWAKEITDEMKKVAAEVSWFGGSTQCFTDWPNAG
jgi:Kyakuja-Dileera-Zisupton transposase